MRVGRCAVHCSLAESDLLGPGTVGDLAYIKIRVRHPGSLSAVPSVMTSLVYQL